jgi:chromosome segregation ATPase
MNRPIRIPSELKKQPHRKKSNPDALYSQAISSPSTATKAQAQSQPQTAMFPVTREDKDALIDKTLTALNATAFHEVNEKLELAKKEIQSKEQRITELTENNNKYRDMENKFESAKKEIQSKEQQITELTEKNDRYHLNYNGLKENYTNLKAKHANLGTQNKGLVNNNQQLGGEKTALERDLDSWKQNHKDSERKRKLLIEQLKEAQDKVARGEQSPAVKQGKEETRKKIENCESRIQELVLQVTGLKSEKQKIGPLQAKVADLQRKIARLDKENEELRGQIQEETAKIQSAQNDGYASENTRLAKENEEPRGQIQEEKAKIQPAQNDEYASENARLIRENEELRGQIQGDTAKIQQAQNDGYASGLQDGYNRGEQETITKAEEAHRQRVAEFVEQIQTLENDKITLSNEKAAQKTRIDQLDRDIETLKEASKKGKDKAESENHDMKERIAQLEGEIQRLKDEKNTSENAMEAQINQMTSDIERLKDAKQEAEVWHPVLNNS